jgi:hypothetical protein
MYFHFVICIMYLHHAISIVHFHYATSIFSSWIITKPHLNYYLT